MPRRRKYGGALTRLQSDRLNLSHTLAGDRNIELINRLKQPRDLPKQPLGQVVNIYNPASLVHSEQIKSAYAEQTGFGRRRRRRHRQRGRGPAVVDKYGQFIHNY